MIAFVSDFREVTNRAEGIISAQEKTKRKLVRLWLDKVIRPMLVELQEIFKDHKERELTEELPNPVTNKLLTLLAACDVFESHHMDPFFRPASCRPH